MTNNVSEIAESKTINIGNGEIQIFSKYTGQPPEETIKVLAKTFREGFNDMPWRIYGWSMSPDKARNEFKIIVAITLNKEGALLSLDHDGSKIGFSVVTDMSIFVERQKQVCKFRRLPGEYIDPGPYFEKIRKEIGIDASDWSKVGYLADIVIDNKFRGLNYGKTLVERSLDYLRAHEKLFALGWSVNPAMSHIFESAGFKLIRGIGNEGEGIDFLVQGRIWYPTLDLPVKEDSMLKKESVCAEHYLKNLKES